MEEDRQRRIAEKARRAAAAEKQNTLNYQSNQNAPRAIRGAGFLKAPSKTAARTGVYQPNKEQRWD